MGALQLSYYSPKPRSREPVFPSKRALGESEKRLKKGINYYPFGMMMPGRTYTNPNLTDTTGDRYGFNGHELDNEISGVGNSYDFGLRHYNSRLGRMFIVDPRTHEYAWQSPYAYHRNSPIYKIDFMGGGDPPAASEQITTLLDKAGEEAQKAALLEKEGNSKVAQALTLKGQVDRLLIGGNATVEAKKKALGMLEEAKALADDGAALLTQAAGHYEKRDGYIADASSLLPSLQQDHEANVAILRQFEGDMRWQALNDILGDALFSFGIGASAIQIFGPTLHKPPYLGSYPGTSIWSKYVAQRFPANLKGRIPLTGGKGLTRGLGRAALPVALALQTYETTKSFVNLYNAYQHGPSKEEQEALMRDFENWKKENGYD